MFLDEAIWRRKYKLFDDRMDFLIQLNAYHNFRFQPGEGFARNGEEYNLDDGNVSDPDDVDCYPDNNPTFKEAHNSESRPKNPVDGL